MLFIIPPINIKTLLKVGLSEAIIHHLNSFLEFTQSLISVLAILQKICFLLFQFFFSFIPVKAHFILYLKCSHYRKPLRKYTLIFGYTYCLYLLPDKLQTRSPLYDVYYALNMTIKLTFLNSLKGVLKIVLLSRFSPPPESVSGGSSPISSGCCPEKAYY